MNTPTSRVLRLLRRVRKQPGGSYNALCPAHQDHRPSLSVATGRNGKTLLRCHRGCSVEEILTSLGLAFSDLFPLKGEHGYRAPSREWGGR